MCTSRVGTILHPLLLMCVGRRCAGCGTTSTVAVCRGCVDELESTPATAGAAYVDAGVAGRLVRRAKRGDWRAGGRVLATLVVSGRPHVVPRCEMVTWVPADRARRARRGGHLPERFARALGEQLGVPARQLLEPTRPRRPQRALGRQARRRNVKGAFRARRDAARHVAPGTRVLLVDDVRTTGATLAAAREVLRFLQLAVESLAIVGVEIPDRAGAGVGNHARSAEIRLRIRTNRADGIGHVLRKAARLRAPRPP